MLKFLPLVVLALALGATESKNLNQRVVEGEEAEPYSIPYQVSIQANPESHFCGGSVINENAILTSALCCEHSPAGDIRVVAGAHKLSQLDGLEQIRDVSQMFIHEGYVDPNVYDDICLLILDAPLDFSDGRVAAVQLPNKDDIFEAGVPAVVSGWGSTDALSEEPSDVLLKTNVPIYDHRQCNIDYTFYFFIGDGMICAGGDFEDFCNGDEGGPLTCDGVLCGVASRHVYCGSPTNPGVYTKTSAYIDWIDSKLQSF